MSNSRERFSQDLSAVWLHRRRLPFYSISLVPQTLANSDLFRREIEPQLTAMGVQLIAITPDRPEKMRESIEKHKLAFRLLSDSQMLCAQAFGVAYKLDEADPGAGCSGTRTSWASHPPVIRG
jgi:hypothetical protein